MQQFLSVDWGTSNFRLRRVGNNLEEALTTVVEGAGIKEVYDKWKNSGEDRTLFYTNYIKKAIVQLEQKLSVSLKDLPIVISGMASSSIGLKELPYKNLPFNINGADLSVEAIPATANFPHLILLISGAKTAKDVMRGEETQLVGCMLQSVDERMVVVLPGTHSKHIFLQGGMAVDFKTYMTGEIFNLLTTNSILSLSVDASGDVSTAANRTSFLAGVQASLANNILHAAFSVRTHTLFNQLSKEANYYYLSGLLIGTELKDLKGINQRVLIAGNHTFNPLYISAYEAICNKMASVEDIDVSVYMGQRTILENYLRNRGDS